MKLSGEQTVTSRTALQLLLVMSHNRMVRSSLPLASRRPSGLNATLLTPPLWPCKRFRERQYPGSPTNSWLHHQPGPITNIWDTVCYAIAAGPTRAKKRGGDHLNEYSTRSLQHMPNGHNVVASAACQQLPIMTERHAADPHGVALQCRTVCPPQEFRATFLEHKSTELFLSVGLS